MTMGMTHFDLTILVIDENAIRASIIEEGLRDAGHQRVTIIHEVNGVARIIETLKPDVIIIDIENPNRDMMEHLFQLTRTLGECGGKQLFLGWEVIIERGFRPADLGRDAVHRRGGIAVFQECGLGDPDDVVAAFVAVRARLGTTS